MDFSRTIEITLFVHAILSFFMDFSTIRSAAFVYVIDLETT